MTASATQGDQARVTALVEVPPELAFRVFTEEIDQWWRRGLPYRVAGRRRGVLCLEPGVGGRLFESFDGEKGAPTVVEAGRVLVWEPPARLVFEWRAANFAEHERTEVEVLFEPSRSGTRVTLTHRGFAALRADHPVRHGKEIDAFVRGIGLWWGDLLSSLREHVARRATR